MNNGPSQAQGARGNRPFANIRRAIAAANVIRAAMGPDRDGSSDSAIRWFQSCQKDFGRSFSFLRKTGINGSSCQKCTLRRLERIDPGSIEFAGVERGSVASRMYSPRTKMSVK